MITLTQNIKDQHLPGTSLNPVNQGQDPRVSFNPSNDFLLTNSGASLVGRVTEPGFFVTKTKNVSSKSLISFVDLLFYRSSGALPLSDGATATEDVIADVSYLVRSPMAEGAVLEVMGITTGENIFQGAWAAIKAGWRFQEARAIGDTGGMIEGGTDAARGFFQSIGGAFFMAYRGTMIPADIWNVNTLVPTTPLGSAAFALGMIGNAFFMIFYVLIGVWAVYGFGKDCELSLAMKKAQEKQHAGDMESPDVKLFKFFTEKVKADSSEKLAKLKREDKEGLAKIALDAMTEQWIREQEKILGTEEGRTKVPLSRDEVRELLANLFDPAQKSPEIQAAREKYIATLGLDKEKVNNFSMLEVIGFKLEEMKRQSRKNAKFSRVAGGANLAAIQKAAARGLKERLESTDPIVKAAAKADFDQLVSSVNSMNNENLIIHGILAVYALLGVVVSIMSFFPVLASGAAMALIILSVVLSAAMLATDAYFMYLGWNSTKEPGLYDKQYIGVIACMLVSMLAISVGVTLGCGLPLVPLIFAGLIGGIGLVLCGISYDELDHKEKKWKWNHPDLPTFTKYVDDQTLPDGQKGITEGVKARFKTLPKDVKRAVRGKYFEMSCEHALRFKTHEFKQLDKHFDFGGAFIAEQLKIEDMKDKRHTLFVSGIKKTLKFCWEKWEKAKSIQNKELALKMQAFFDAVKVKDGKSAQKAYAALDLNSEGYLQLKKDLWYVAKRQESKSGLKRVLRSIA